MSNERLKRHIAQEAARIIAEEGVSDYRFAKQKAAARLGAGTKTSLPANREVEAALQEHLRLFHADTQPGQVRAMRETALRIMSQLETFQPRLVGAVLRGTADQDTPIELHLFADAPEEIAFFLLDRHINYDPREHRWRRGEETITTPVFVLDFDQYEVRLHVFPLLGLRKAPLCPVERRSMQRADRAKVKWLLGNP